MAKERNEWIWEPNIVIRGTPEEIVAYRQMFKETCNARDKGTTTVGGELFLYGLIEADKNVAILNTLTTTNPSINQYIIEIGKEERDIKQLRKVLHAKYANDLDGFVTMCHNWNVSDNIIQTVLAEFSMEIPSWHSKAAEWLRNILSQRHEPCHVNEIRKMAIDAEIISDSEQEWAKMRQLASREGFTGGDKGYWQYVVT